MFREESKRIVLQRWPEGGDEMKFRLVYDGELPPEDYAGADDKHRIRRQFHPQLRTLWYDEPSLKRLTEADASGRSEVDAIADDYAKHGFRFVPLVRTANEMGCRIEILILMQREPRLFKGQNTGDLDNRVKTLLDGLRMPTHQKSELGTAATTGPCPDEDPFFCLFEDDKSVYEIAVQTDRLLAPTRPGQAVRDVVAVVNVHVTSILRHDFAYLSSGFGLVKKKP